MHRRILCYIAHIELRVNHTMPHANILLTLTIKQMRNLVVLLFFYACTKEALTNLC